MYSPRISGPTISVVRACKGAWRAEAAMLKTAIPTTSQTPQPIRETITNRNASATFAQMMIVRLPA